MSDQANAPRTLTLADFAGGRCWVIPPGPMTPKQLVVGSLAPGVAQPEAGERVLIDIPNFVEIGLAVSVDGRQLYHVIEGGLFTS